MFLGPFDQGAEWNDKTEQLLIGVSRFLNRVWNLVQAGFTAPAGEFVTTPEIEKEIRRTTHKTIKRVEDDLGHWAFNTALSGLMEFSNTLGEIAAREPGIYGNPAWKEAVETLLLLLAPLSPHITEELWHQMGHDDTIHSQRLPAYDPSLAVDEVTTVIIQINGKVRDKLEIPVGLDEDAVKAAALASPKVAQAVGAGHPKKVIYVPGKLINVVV
jgi:leucyl-tRNA synthetase